MTAETSDRTMHYTDYCVAFVDLLGQQDELMKLAELPRSEETRDQVFAVLKRTMGRVKKVRTSFAQYFTEASKTLHVAAVPPDKRAQWTRLREQTFHQVGFSDAFVVATPLLRTEEFGHAKGVQAVHSMLVGVAGAQLLALSMGIPFRAGIEIERGIDMYENEVYGPVLVKAYLLERDKADYPRAAVGDGLVRYVEQVRQIPDSGAFDESCVYFSTQCFEMLCTDPQDHQVMLDFLSPRLLRLGMDGLVAPAFKWVSEEHERQRAAGNARLIERYERLLRYFAARGVSQ